MCTGQGQPEKEVTRGSWRLCKRGRGKVLRNMEGCDCHHLFHLSFLFTEKFLFFTVEEPRFHVFQVTQGHCSAIVSVCGLCVCVPTFTA